MKFYIRSKNYTIGMPHIQAYRRLERTVFAKYGVSYVEQMDVLNSLTYVYIKGITHARWSISSFVRISFNGLCYKRSSSDCSSNQLIKKDKRWF